MKAQKIGFDLDRVFIGYPPLIPQQLIDWLYKHSLHELLSLKIHPEKKMYYRFPHSEAEQIIRKLSHWFLLRPRLTANIDFVKKLTTDNPSFEIYLISSRYKFLEKITLNILNRYELSSAFKKIYLNVDNEQPHFFKEKIIKQLNLNLFVDDDLKLLKYIQGKSKTKLIWYNPMNYQNDHQGITMIHKLDQIKNYLK